MTNPIDLIDRLHDVHLIGHPFAPMGMGQQLRSMSRSLRALGAPTPVVDLYRLMPRTDLALVEELKGSLVDRPGQSINVFHLNGDEIEQALAHIGGLPDGAYNIVYPAWELPAYPAKWARELERFDEVWTPSRYVRDAVSAAVARPVHAMPMGCEVRVRRMFGRRHFGIPESSFAFLFFFDFTSYMARKNPQAVVEAFARMQSSRPRDDACLVLKMNRGQLAAADYETFRATLARRPERIVLLDGTLDDDEIKSLVRCCDAFVSLHRAEGYGFGIAEAMALGKPVIATGWSGNMDFMDPAAALPVRHSMVPVGPGEYPFGEGQSWAQPDVDHAVELMGRLLASRVEAARLGTLAARHMRVHFSYRARGLAYADRLLDILAQRTESGSAPAQVLAEHRGVER